jgi:hypothetical protein
MSDELPADLLSLGFKIVRFPSGRMCATSQSFGCSGASTDLQEVIRNARSISAWCKEQNRLRAYREHRAAVGTEES